MILGLNLFHGDSAAALLAGGELRAAVEEERFTRVKHWAGLPAQSIRYCLESAGGTIKDVEAIGVSRKPNAYILQKAALALRNPRSIARAVRRLQNLSAVRGLGAGLAEALGVEERSLPPIHGVEHHLAHIASAFHCSPHEEAMCLTVDGFGDFVSTMFAVGRGNGIEVLGRVHFPHSLGLFYTAMTQYLGFPNYGDEYKVMGLAAYGDPGLAEKISQLLLELPEGMFALDLRYFTHLREGVEMTWDGGEPKLGPVFSPALGELLGPPRRPDEELTQRHKDIAASTQRVYENHLFRMVRALQKRTGLKALCMAGGCGQNSLANGKLFDNTDIKDVYIQAAAADNGTSLGAALYIQHCIMNQPRAFVMDHCYWGPEHSTESVRAAIAEGIPGSGGQDGRWGEFEVKTCRDEDELARETAEGIASGEVVGWHQGRAEWGPRALGNRSILADPRRGDMRDLLNVKIKRRESFRPFAPSILEERVGDWFTISYPDPFMIKVYPIREERRATIPAVTHADGTGRLQSVSQKTNRRYWKLIHAFEEKTGVPILLNTSFNENEPIVNTPKEALDCFLRTKMDRLAMGDVTVRRVGG